MKEVYNLGNPKTAVGGLIVGESYIEPIGETEIINYNTGEKAVMDFASRGWVSSAKHEVKIAIKDA